MECITQMQGKLEIYMCIWMIFICVHESHIQKKYMYM